MTIVTNWTKIPPVAESFPLASEARGDWFETGGWFLTGFFAGVGQANSWTPITEPATTWNGPTKSTTAWTKTPAVSSGWTKQ
jgi:hypothetical protein